MREEKREAWGMERKKESEEKRLSVRSHPEIETRGLTLAPVAPFSPGAGAGRARPPSLPPSFLPQLGRPRNPAILLSTRTPEGGLLLPRPRRPPPPPNPPPPRKAPPGTRGREKAWRRRPGGGRTSLTFSQLPLPHADDERRVLAVVDEPQAQGLHALLRVAQLRQLPLQRRLRERRHRRASLGPAAPTGPARPRSVPASPPQRGRSRASPVPSRLAGRHFRAPRQPGANKMAAAQPPGEPPGPAPFLLLSSLPPEAHSEAGARRWAWVPVPFLPRGRAPPSRLSQQPVRGRRGSAFRAGGRGGAGPASGGQRGPSAVAAVAVDSLGTCSPRVAAGPEAFAQPLCLTSVFGEIS